MTRMDKLKITDKKIKLITTKNKYLKDQVHLLRLLQLNFRN